MGIARIKRNLDVDTQDVGVRCNLNDAIGLSFASIYCRRQRKGGKRCCRFLPALFLFLQKEGSAEVFGPFFGTLFFLTLLSISLILVYFKSRIEKIAMIFLNQKQSWEII